VIARQAALRTGDDKTSVMFTTAHAPGALHRVLGVFADAGINLTHIDKRPSGRDNWSYTFFVDLEGHRDDDSVARALERARTQAHELWVLGSYPRARRVL
jgi:chorismate mutase/prephenate dehydratase